MLIKDIDRNGYEGIGKPEPLKGKWSKALKVLQEVHSFIERMKDEPTRSEIA